MARTRSPKLLQITATQTVCPCYGVLVLGKRHTHVRHAGPAERRVLSIDWEPASPGWSAVLLCAVAFGNHAAILLGPLLLRFMIIENPMHHTGSQCCDPAIAKGGRERSQDTNPSRPCSGSVLDKGRLIVLRATSCGMRQRCFDGRHERVHQQPVASVRIMRRRVGRSRVPRR